VPRGWTSVDNPAATAADSGSWRMVKIGMAAPDSRWRRLLVAEGCRNADTTGWWTADPFPLWSPLRNSKWNQQVRLFNPHARRARSFTRIELELAAIDAQTHSRCAHRLGFAPEHVILAILAPRRVGGCSGGGSPSTPVPSLPRGPPERRHGQRPVGRAPDSTVKACTSPPFGRQSTGADHVQLPRISRLPRLT